MRTAEARGLDINFISEHSGRLIHAVDNASFCIDEGETVGLVGTSGSGKSTLAKMLAGLLRPEAGEIFICGQEMGWPYKKETYRDLQMVFQFPERSFDPRRRIGEAIMLPQRNFGVSKDKAKENTFKMLTRVGLSGEYFAKYPHELSGGECQRAAIARAAVVRPRLMICDEVTSALDADVRDLITEMLLELKDEMNMSMLFISHDERLTEKISSRILIMEDGCLYES